MTTFDNREKAFENKYAHEERLNFDVEARCSKLFGLWAAKKMGFSGDAALVYAKEVVGANLDEPGFEDVLRKVKADFQAQSIDVSDHIMDEELNKALEEAKRQIMDEKK